MKYLVLILILFLPKVFAGNWISESDLVKAKNNENGVTIYSRAVRCQKKTGENCTDISGKDLRYHDLQDVQINDWNNPIFSLKEDVESCADAIACNVLLEAPKVCTTTNNWSQAGPNTLMPGWSVWCWRRQGFEQITVKQLVENLVDKSAVETSDAVKKDVEKTQRSARKAARARLKALDVGNLSQADIDQAIKDLIRTR